MEEVNQEQPIIEQKSSFKLVRNAKGNYQFEIKCYGETPEEIMKNTEILNKWAEEKYPREQ